MHWTTAWSCCIIPSSSKAPLPQGLQFHSGARLCHQWCQALIPSCVGFVVWSALYCDINRHTQTLPEANNSDSPQSHTDKPRLLSCIDASRGHVFCSVLILVWEFSFIHCPNGWRLHSLIPFELTENTFLRVVELVGVLLGAWRKVLTVCLCIQIWRTCTPAGGNISPFSVTIWNWIGLCSHEVAAASHLSQSSVCLYWTKRGSVGPLTALQPCTPRDLEEERERVRKKQTVSRERMGGWFWKDEAQAMFRTFFRVNGWMTKGRKEARWCCRAASD